MRRTAGSRLAKTCERYRDSFVAINTAARNKFAVKHYGRTLDSSLTSLEAGSWPRGDQSGA